MIAGIFSFGSKPSEQYESISPGEAKLRLDKNPDIVIIDVRTPEEFRSETGHLRNATLIPLHELPVRVHELEGDNDRSFLVYCRSGHRSLDASDYLSKEGFKVMNLEGGILRWRRESLEVVRE